MKLKILGCSGGIGGSARTTAMMLDTDVLIDAGTGVGDLSLEEMIAIDHIFITHSHLDHIAAIPLLIDSVGFLRKRPLTLHATVETQQILEEHIFNWKIWPDFSTIPTADQPLMRFEQIRVGQTVDLDGRRITALPANHTVPAIGYQLDSGAASLVFTGDTTATDELWQVINNIENIRYLLIETAFCERERNLAIISKHLHPSLLAQELAKLKRPAEIFISHLKPGEGEITMQEVQTLASHYRPRMLVNGQMFSF